MRQRGVVCKLTIYYSKRKTNHEPCKFRYGISKEWSSIKLNNPFIYNGLDRLDSSRDHSEDNIVTCCADCNKAKMDKTVEEFRLWIEKIYKYQFLT